ncbi:hypothetical protein ACRAWG_00970 [Methylobacterium sp. P31]
MAANLVCGVSGAITIAATATDATDLFRADEFATIALVEALAPAYLIGRVRARRFRGSAFAVLASMHLADMCLHQED